MHYKHSSKDFLVCFLSLLLGFSSLEILLSLENLVRGGQGGITRWDSQAWGPLSGHVVVTVPYPV